MDLPIQTGFSRFFNIVTSFIPRFVTKISKALPNVFVALMLSTLAACQTNTPIMLPITLIPDSGSIPLGGTQVFTATAANDELPNITWNLEPSIGATLTPNAKTTTFTGNTAGVYTLTATDGTNTTRKVSASVTVTAPSVDLHSSTTVVTVGKSTVVEALVTGAINTNVVWTVQPTSNAPAIPNGTQMTFTPTAMGKYTITATSQADPSKSANLSIDVSSPVVSLNTADATITTFQNQLLTATVKDAINPNVKWSISPKTGAVLINNGNTVTLNAHRPGLYTVTASSLEDDSRQAIANVIVNAGRQQVLVNGRANYTLALKPDGTVWAWGLNDYGQLGNGTTTNSGTPSQVLGLRDVISIAAGSAHSLALKSDGTVWAWGKNSDRQLGNGTFDNSSFPVQIPGLTNVTAIAAGDNHTLVLRDDGNVLAWGNNNYAQLGRINLSDPPLTNVTVIAAAGDHSLALKSDGSVWEWGFNQFLPPPTEGSPSRPIYSGPVQVMGLTGIVAISDSPGNFVERGTSYALKSDGSVWGIFPRGWFEAV